MNEMRFFSHPPSLLLSSYLPLPQRVSFSFSRPYPPFTHSSLHSIYRAPYSAAFILFIHKTRDERVSARRSHDVVAEDAVPCDNRYALRPVKRGHPNQNGCDFVAFTVMPLVNGAEKQPRGALCGEWARSLIHLSSSPTLITSLRPFIYLLTYRAVMSLAVFITNMHL